jgi:Tol biopolymer transport system component
MKSSRRLAKAEWAKCIGRATGGRPNPDQIVYNLVGWQDATHVVGFGQKGDERSRGYVQEISGGPPRAFTPEGMTATLVRWWLLPIAPDGKRVVGSDEHGTPLIYRIDGSAAQSIAGLAAGDVPVQWTPDGRALIVAHGEGLPWVVERLDLSTGKRTPAITIRAHDPAGLYLSMFAIWRDAKYYVHSYSRLLSGLLVVNGLQ